MSKGSDVVEAIVGLCILVCIFASFPASLLMTALIAWPLAIDTLGAEANSWTAFWILFGGIEILLVGLVLWAGVACIQTHETR